MITAPQVRLISDTSEQLGIVSRDDALAKAQESGMDLVEVSPNAAPPVCRIMDHGKYQFQASKKKSAARKKQRTFRVKEVKFRPVTEDGDFQVKLRNLTGFLEAGDKVKVTMRFRGREMAHQEIGLELLKRVEAATEAFATVEQYPKLEGRQMVMIIAPIVKQVLGEAKGSKTPEANKPENAE